MKTLFCNADHEHTESCYEDEKEGGDLLNVVYDEVKQLKEYKAALIASYNALDNHYQIIMKQNDALKELIPIAEDLAFIVKENRDNYWMDDKIEKYKSAIESAKKLITPQKEQTPQ